MYSESEKRFMQYWETYRLQEKKSLRQLLIGIPVGLIFAIPILIVLFSGKWWYHRAEAAINTRANPTVLIVAILLITAFVAFFYKRHQWEMHEQKYQELLQKARKEKQEINTKTESSETN